MIAERIAKSLSKGHKRLGGWQACCSAHVDSNPSLSLTDRDGKVLVKCHAGCSQDDVVTALRALGLWPEPKRRFQVDHEFNYTDECGQLLYQVVRQLTPKDFRQRFPDLGGWVWKKHPLQVLYNLPQVLASPIVFESRARKTATT